MSRNQSQSTCLFHFVRLSEFSLSLSEKLRFWPNYTLFFRLFIVSLIMRSLIPDAIAQKSGDYVHAGFIFDRHELTLTPGDETQAAGPFFYRTDSEFEDIFAFPPFFSRSTIEATDSEEYDFLYPLLTY